MRRIAVPILAVVLLGCLAGYLYKQLSGSHGASNTVDVTIPRAVQHGNTIDLQDSHTAIQAGGDTISKTVQTLIEAANTSNAASPFPSGTRLLGVKVESGTAIVDLSAEFEQVNKQGDTSESLAQQALRRVLAQFPQVTRMRVLVEGRIFEGDHSGPWDSVSVRDQAADSGNAP